MTAAEADSHAEHPTSRLPARAEPGACRRHRAGIAAEVGLVVLAPLLVGLLLGARRMVPIRMIDPSFYTAYALHGPELIQRYGDDTYYWVRQGFLLPARMAYLLFGPVPGFLVVRYVFALIAIVPTYLLMRRLHGRLAGALAVAVVLTSQVVLAAWGTDYPDSAAVTYLFAGATCLFMPAAKGVRLAVVGQGVRRVGWVIAAGAALTLAVHSQMYAVPLVAALVVAYVVAYVAVPSPDGSDERGQRRARRWHEALLHALVLAVVFVLVTGLVVVAARAVFGSANLIEPTLEAARSYRRPTELAKWHSTTWRWIVNDPYLAMPPAVVGAWLVLVAGRWRTGARPGWVETGIVLATTLQGMTLLAAQFLAQAAVLEFFFYSSMLWPGVCLTTALLLLRLSEPLGGAHPAVRVLPIVVVLATPLAFVPWTPELELDLDPVGLVLFGTVLATAALAARWPRAVVALVATTAAVVCTHALVVGVPTSRPLAAGQVALPSPPYGEVTGFDDQEVVDRYTVTSRVVGLAPAPDGTGTDDLVLWWPGVTQTLSRASGLYLWHRNALPETMPELTDRGVAMLREREPEHLLLLSETGSEFEAALAALGAAGFDAQVLRTETFRQGDVELHVQVLSVEGYGA